MTQTRSRASKGGARKPATPRILKSTPAAQGGEASQELEFGPLNDQVGYALRRAYAILFRTFSEMFQDLNLAFGQYSILVLVGQNPGVSQMAIADAADVDRTTIVPILHKFAQLRWITRRRRTADRRVYSLHLTAAGQAVLDATAPIIAAHEERLFGPLTAAERATLGKLLSKVVESERGSRAKTGSRDDA